MSYQRSPSINDWFYSVTEYYVWGEFVNKTKYQYGDPETVKIYDCGARYSHNPSLINLIGDFIYDECKDMEFATKIVKVLARKLGCEDQLRPRRVSTDEFLKEHKELSRILGANHGAVQELMITFHLYEERKMDNPRLAEKKAIADFAEIHDPNREWIRMHKIEEQEGAI